MAELRHRVHIKDEKLQHHQAGEEEVESKRQDEGARHILAAVLLVVAALFWLVFRALRTSRPETKTLYESTYDVFSDRAATHPSSSVVNKSSQTELPYAIKLYSYNKKLAMQRTSTALP